ncbi:MAG: caspase family protein [Acidobacteria bacterium]|nr:caspase family protein [Acidobacteriota bacterium]
MLLRECSQFWRINLMSTALLSLLWMSAALVGVARANDLEKYYAEKSPAKRALVIGNSAYTTLGRIPSSKTDGEMIKARLEKLKFDTVDYYPDVKTVDEFEDVVIPGFRHKVKEGDLVVIYFSGHGFSYGADNFLVPTEMPIPISGKQITKFAEPVDALIGAVAKREPGLIMTFIDACRSVGGIVVNDNLEGLQGVSKGHIAPTNRHNRVNHFIFYATSPGEIAEGFNETTRLSRFTQALYDKIATPSQPFVSVFRDIANEVLEVTNEGQNPYHHDFSKTDPPLLPTEEYVAAVREAWRSTLPRRDPKEIAKFLRRYSISLHASACRDFLRDDWASRYTRVSPVAVERAFERTDFGSVGILRLETPLAYERSVDVGEEQALGMLADARLGLVTAESPEAGVLMRRSKEVLSRYLESLSTHKTTVTTKELVGLTRPDRNAVVMRHINAGTLLEINNVIQAADNQTYVSVTLPETATNFFIRIPTEIPQLLQLGNPLKEVLAPPRAASIPDLVDPAPIRNALAELKAQGFNITWVSLSTAAVLPAQNELERAKMESEQDARLLRLANAEYIIKNELKDEGMDSRQITSISGSSDFSGDGVRVRFFGVKRT